MELLSIFRSIISLHGQENLEVLVLFVVAIVLVVYKLSKDAFFALRAATIFVSIIVITNMLAKTI